MQAVVAEHVRHEFERLEYFREGRSEKHLRDIRAMIAVSGEELDRAMLNEWIQRQGLESEWRQVG